MALRRISPQGRTRDLKRVLSVFLESRAAHAARGPEGEPLHGSQLWRESPAGGVRGMTGRIESLVRKFSITWESFWFSEGSTFNIALFRILFALALFFEVGVTLYKGLFAIEGGFHLPYLEFVQLVTRETYELIHLLQIPFVLFLGLGLFTRLSCSALIVLQGYIFFADQLNFRNHPYFFLLVLFLLLFSPADDALSIKSVYRALKHRQPIIASLLGHQQSLTFQRLIQVQVCIVYVYAAFHKLNMGYLSGYVLEGYLGELFQTGRPGFIFNALFPEPFLAGLDQFVLSSQTLIALSVLSVLFEFGLPLALWFRKTRPFALILGIGFHLGIFLGMDIFNFSLAMIASYLLFLDPETLVSRLRPNPLRDRPELEQRGQTQEINKARSETS